MTPPNCWENLLTVDNIALLVVDPARSFIKGNEDESANVDAALSTLVRFAAEKQCAVVVLHHLKKSARPASPHDAVEGLRGSGAFKARARVAIGIVRKGDVVSVGVAKHNMPPQYPMLTETKKFRRQAGTPRLVGLEDASVVKSSTSEDGALQDVARIVDAIRAARARDVPVMRSGRSWVTRAGGHDQEWCSRSDKARAGGWRRVPDAGRLLGASRSECGRRSPPLPSPIWSTRQRGQRRLRM